MRKIFLVLALVTLIISVASATISLEKNPNQIYNMGDILETPIKIIADNPIEGFLTLKLSCGSAETEIYKEYISLSEGEKSRDIAIPLKKELIGDSKGTCSLKYEIGPEKGNLTNTFKISNKILISLNEMKNLFSPEETVQISGEAKKENGELVEGIIEANISLENLKNMIYSNVIEKGIFNININLPQNTKAGILTLNLYAYEKNKEGIVINNGTSVLTIEVEQIPTNLEIVLEKSSIIPTEEIKGKVLLHDQTGENMGSLVYLSLKNEEGKIVEKTEIQTEHPFEYLFNSTQEPGKWKITAYIENIASTVNFEIKENKELETILENNTLIVKNVGNVLYNDILEIQIGENLEELSLDLDIGEQKTFILTAPNGEYQIQIGDETHTTVLTGKVVEIKEFSEKTFAINPIIWIFVILILGFIIFTLFKKGYKKTFLGRRIGKKNKSAGDSFVVPNKIEHQKIKSGFIHLNFPAELSISLQGTKQQSDIISINLKNNHELTGDGGVKETLQNMVKFAEELKAFTYYTKDNVFFILAPVKTKTFKNESAALSIALESDKLLKHHNKLFKQKIDYGIAIDSGNLVIKVEKITKFMAMNNLMTNLKKISHYSDKGIYMSEVIRGRLGSIVKTDRENAGTIAVYKLKEIVKKMDNSKFVQGFLHRLEKDKQRLVDKERTEK